MSTGLVSRLVAAWGLLSPLPGGKWLFTRLLGRMVPYTGALGARVEVLEPGHAVVTLRERRRIRNHLHSVHAVALANLAEVTSGLATLTAAGDQIRGIVTALQINYHHKARGRLRAESRVTLPTVITQPVEMTAQAFITDSQQLTVATLTATWLLEPVS